MREPRKCGFGRGRRRSGDHQLLHMGQVCFERSMMELGLFLEFVVWNLYISVDYFGIEQYYIYLD